MHRITPSRRLLLPIAGLLAAAGITACGGDDSSTPPPPTSASTTPAPSGSSTSASGSAGPAKAGSTRDTLSASPNGDLAFDKTSLSAKAGTVRLVMTNPGSSGQPHGIAISGNGVNESGQVVQPGATSTVTTKLKAGTYTFFCPVPGHAEAGMKGTLTVR